MHTTERVSARAERNPDRKTITNITAGRGEWTGYVRNVSGACEERYDDSAIVVDYFDLSRELAVVRAWSNTTHFDPFTTKIENSSFAGLDTPCGFRILRTQYTVAVFSFIRFFSSRFREVLDVQLASVRVEHNNTWYFRFRVRFGYILVCGLKNKTYLINQIARL